MMRHFERKVVIGNMVKWLAAGAGLVIVLMISAVLAAGDLAPDVSGSAITATAPTEVLAALLAANPEHKAGTGQLVVDAKTGTVRIRGCPKISNIDALTGAAFCTDLTLHGCGVSSLEPIRNLKLTRLDVGDCPVADLEPIRGMPIIDLVVVNCKVKSLGPVGGMPLRKLMVNGVQRSYYQVLGELKTLEELQIDYCKFDRELLKKLPFTLKTLVLSHVTFGSKNPVDLESFGQQPLTTLSLADCEVVNWSALAQAGRLKSLTLANVAVDDIKEFKGLPLEVLKLTNNNPRALVLTDLKAFPLKQLMLRNCTADLASLAGSSVEELEFTPAAITRGCEALRECSQLKSITVFMVDSAGKEQKRTYRTPSPAKAFLQDVADGKIQTAPKP